MTILHLTPGAGKMYCGACLRDNGLVRGLRALGHNALMVPLYLPLTLDETDESAQTPIFFGGISVYLDQQSGLFRKAPAWIHRLLASRPLLGWAAGRAARTHPRELGELTFSMLRGEEGRQAVELEEMLVWLREQPRPDVICLSNALLLGMARRLKDELKAPIVCTFQGEDYFMDSLSEPWRSKCWALMADRATDADAFVAPSGYFAGRMAERLRLPDGKARVVYNGINLDGYGCSEERGGLKELNELNKLNEGGDSRFQISNLNSDESRAGVRGSSSPREVPVLGFFARMCPEKGLDGLVEAYIQVRQRGHFPELRLRIGGSCGPADEPLVQKVKHRLGGVGLLDQVEFWPNLAHRDKIAFLKSLTVFSVPALYGEAFGLYVIEALAAAVPVVQPRTAAFPEVIEATGGGVLCTPGDPVALADGIEALLREPDRARALGKAGCQAVHDRFSEQRMVAGMCRVFEEVRTGTGIKQLNELNELKG